jgi:hypothetical protein
MLQFTNTILNIRPPVVIAPDLLSGLRVAGYEDAKV